MAVTLQQFAGRLVQSGLFSAEELAAFQRGLPPDKRPESLQDLAREPILADKLTRYQAEAVYCGQIKGLVMGNYVVLDKIGAGGMGEVLKAHHRKMDRVVALKVLPRKAMRSEDALKRFYREVKAPGARHGSGWCGQLAPLLSCQSGARGAHPQAGRAGLGTRAGSEGGRRRPAGERSSNSWGGLILGVELRPPTC